MEATMPVMSEFNVICRDDVHEMEDEESADESAIVAQSTYLKHLPCQGDRRDRSISQRISWALSH